MITRYIGDRLISNSTSDIPYPTDVLEGAELYSIPLKVKYSFYNNSWNPVESGIAGLVYGSLGNTIYNMGTQWTGSWNIWNNGDLIGFGFNSNSPLPLNKGHFYSNSGNAGFATGIILESQSDSGDFSDWGSVADVMSTSGDWGSGVSSMTSSGDWGNVLDATTPGISIDVKLSQDRRTVSALRFRRLTSGTSNYDSTIEFWVTDSGSLFRRFWIQSGQFLPELSGQMFLGSPDLPFSGIHSLKAVLNQLQFNNSVIPSSGGLLTANSGQLYWSGSNVLIQSGVTHRGVLVYNRDYPNTVTSSGILGSGGRLQAGQINLTNTDIPLDSGAMLTNTSGKLYWSGTPVLIHSGFTNDGIITYNADYPNANVETGVKISGQRMELGQVRFATSDIPFDVSGVLHQTSGKLYWSGRNILVHSGVTNHGVVTYNADYPNANIETGILISGQRMELGQIRIGNTTTPFDTSNVLSASGGFLLWTGVRIPTMDFNGSLSRRSDINITAATGSGIGIQIPNNWQYSTGLSKLRVNVNGQLMTANHPITDWTYGDYSEFSPTGVIFVMALPTGTRINFEIMV